MAREKKPVHRVQMTEGKRWKVRYQNNIFYSKNKDFDKRIIDI